MVRIEHCDPSTAYSITISKVGTSTVYGYSETTDSEGKAEWTFVDGGGFTEGHWVVQLREGHEVYSGSTLDTAGLYIEDDS